MNARRQLPESRALAIAVALATLLALGLRAWGITGQAVLDDEWHAIHKLATSSYRNIVRTFGLADHSIPLTLLYKAMADTIGLAEGRLRAPQIVCGVAFVPAGAWLAWRATRDAPVAALFAFLLAGAPFLVLWSRFARPYSIALLFTTLCVAAIWRWRTQRTWRWAGWAALFAALSAWFHLLFALYPVIACVFVFAEDSAAPRTVRPRP
jgi:predicted membrane-bound mannosyltransferase